MVNVEGIFSLRLVIADFYMDKPIHGLDPRFICGKEIKKVPIIRIFGSNGNGLKTCMHIHGVFPYFYIPFAKDDFDSVHKAVFLIATNLDKAINISLGQGSSASHHVFKIQLVKGVPFYGYHKREHHLMKIYMYNPRFVRRAANLLQSGAIMGKNFHPYESHVPYILQFMIDYNLYGMSFIHVPLDVLKFRRANDQDEMPWSSVKMEQILSLEHAKKVSCCSLEVDITSNFILNRFQLLAESNSIHSNPGIESIWHDEQLRRQKLKASEGDGESDIPPLEIPGTQERLNVQPTKTDTFYRSALQNKLLTLESSMSGSMIDETIGSVLQQQESDPNKTKGFKNQFNLSKLLQNAVYPGECDETDQIVNASFIENHLSSGPADDLLQRTLSHVMQGDDSVMQMSPLVVDEDSSYMDDTVIDENLVLSLTQHVPLNASLRDEDMKLLDLLEQLEENELNENCIDLDSTLAQLTQQPEDGKFDPKSRDKEFMSKVSQENISDSESDPDDEHGDSKLHDYSIAMDDIDEIMLRLTQTSKSSNTSGITQMDGADDSLQSPAKSILALTKQHTPTRSRGKSSSSRQPHSPRTPNSGHRYNPLPLIVVKSKMNISKKNLIESLSLSQRYSMNQAKESPTTVCNTQDEVSSRSVRRTRRKMNELDKTHITCSLTPRRSGRRILKTCSVSQDSPLSIETTEAASSISGKASSISGKASSISGKVKGGREMISTNETSETEQPQSPAVELNRNEKEEELYKVSNCDANRTDSMPQISHPAVELNRNEKEEELHKVTNCDANRTDSMPQTSHPNDNNSECEEEIPASDNEEELSVKLLKTPNLKRLRRHFESSNSGKSKSRRLSLQNTPKCRNGDSVAKSSPRLALAPNAADPSSDEDDERLLSFYEHSFVLDSPSVLSEISSSPGVGYGKERQSRTQSPQIERKETTPICSQGQPVVTNEFVLGPLELPPSYDEALADCAKFHIEEYEFQRPFFSNPDDVTKDKEMGALVLRIPGNKVKDLPGFESLVNAQHKGLMEWRRRRVAQSVGPLIVNRCRSTKEFRSFCVGFQRIGVEPFKRPPTMYDAKLWLKARHLMDEKHTKTATGDDSPIKVRRQKVTMMLSEEGGVSASGSDPGIVKTSEETELVTKQPSRRRHLGSEKDESGAADTSFHKSKSHDCTQLEGCSGGSSTSHLSEASIVSSQSVLKEMERSSFIRDIQSCPKGRSDISFASNNSFGFKVKLENLQLAKSDIECNYLTIVTLEVFVATRGDLVPNPERDEIRCIFYAVEDSVPSDENAKTKKLCGYIIINEYGDVSEKHNFLGIDADIARKVVASEIEAIEQLLALCSQWDADIYAGYEIETASWGYVIERAKCLCMNIAPLLSRVPTQKTRDFVDEERDQFTDLDIEMKLCGRILLDVWRLMRSEIALTSYTFENVIYHILHKRCPWHSYRTLSDWFEVPATRWIVIEYYLERVRGTLALMEQLDLIGRTSEMAKLIGIQFYEVLSRGSQFRVESMMLRIAKPRNLVPISPSVQQRAHMRAPEYLPLILEPESRFYADPVIVLDFQSLYPSMIIGYNYCFSTCLGRVEHLGQSTPFEFGASQLRVPPALVRDLLDRDLVTISPCGVVFVKAAVREGILPRMLKEILDTRQMVKQSMKVHKTNSALQRILHSRQLGLKLMANVTYGYTAANFSGRMPAVEVGDSVVAKGRETLERAIEMVQANARWNVRVVYGDTDSLFVLVPGRNREQAFKIGEEIAAAVSDDNPYPVKLKLEKVYQPCILQTKKRYVGYMYESASQKDAVYEAKGIETVRRDGCPVVAKMLEKVLRILFETTDVSKVKQYVCRQFTKLLTGCANLQDLIFAKEFRGLNGYKPTACVPALEMTRKWMLSDPRRVPRRGERVPYVVINGPPGVPLIRLVRHPHEVLANEGYKINAIYYITKAIIPALNRCLLLVGADVNDWFADLPRKILLTPALSTASEIINLPQKTAGGHKKSTISQYFSTTSCMIGCGRQTKNGICSECDADRQKTVVTLSHKCMTLERSYLLTTQVCQACCGRSGDLACSSLDCPVMYVVDVKRRELNQLNHIRKRLEERELR